MYYFNCTKTNWKWYQNSLLHIDSVFDYFTISRLLFFPLRQNNAYIKIKLNHSAKRMNTKKTGSHFLQGHWIMILSLFIFMNYGIVYTVAAYGGWIIFCTAVPGYCCRQLCIVKKNSIPVLKAILNIFSMCFYWKVYIMWFFCHMPCRPNVHKAPFSWNVVSMSSK